MSRRSGRPSATTASSVPSVDALSTSTTEDTGCVCRASDRRQSSSISLRLYVTTTATTDADDSDLATPHPLGPQPRRDVLEAPAPPVPGVPDDPLHALERVVVPQHVLDDELHRRPH